MSTLSAIASDIEPLIMTKNKYDGQCQKIDAKFTKNMPNLRNKDLQAVYERTFFDLKKTLRECRENLAEQYKLSNQLNGDLILDRYNPETKVTSQVQIQETFKKNIEPLIASYQTMATKSQHLLETLQQLLRKDSTK